MRQKTETTISDAVSAFNYPDFVICGLFEKENRLLYGDFSEFDFFERDAMFIGEYQRRLATERVADISG